MNRSTVVTHLGLATLAFGALVLSSATLGVAFSSVERPGDVSVAETPDEAVITVNFTDGNEDPTYQKPVNESFTLLNLTNNLNQSLEITKVEINELDGLTMFSPAPNVTVTDKPRTPSFNETGGIEAECQEQTQGASSEDPTHEVVIYTDTGAPTENGTARFEAEITREFTVECTGGGDDGSDLTTF